MVKGLLLSRALHLQVITAQTHERPALLTVDHNAATLGTVKGLLGRRVLLLWFVERECLLGGAFGCIQSRCAVLLANEHRIYVVAQLLIYFSLCYEPQDPRPLCDSTGGSSQMTTLPAFM